MLTAAQLAALKSELTTDPLSLGYAAPRAAGAMQTIADILNATTGPGAATVTYASLSRDAFVSGLRPGLFALPTLSAAIQAKYSLLIQSVIGTVDAVVIDATTLAFLADAVADGVMTQAQVTAFTTRTGSRAEVLLGTGTAVQWQDVVQALAS